MATKLSSVREDIDGINVRTKRLNTLRQQYFDSDAHICAGRPHLATQSWKETEGEHIHIRRAKLFAKICDEIPITVRDKELIVGSQTPFPRGGGPQLDFNSKGGLELEAGDRRTRAEQISGVLSEDDLKTLVEDTHYWQGRSPGERVYEAIRQVLGSTMADLEEGIIDKEIAVQNSQTRCPDYGKVLQQGLRGVIAEIEEKAASLRFTSVEDGRRWQFLQAAKICCEAVVRYAKRHAELARQLASVERDEDRKGELETIAKVCEHVPENPARNFWEALQSVRFILLATNLETGGRNEVTGRMDQYLYPFYKSDLEQGKITRQQAAELLGCLWMKFAEMELLLAGHSKFNVQGNHGNKMTLGGIDREGKDASNELTYLILHVAGQMKTAEPAVHFRCHSGTPKELLLKAAWANVQTGSHPAFHNDEQTIPGLVADGASLEDARDYFLVGCVHPFAWGSLGGGPGGPMMNGAKILELVMYNGFDLRTGKRLGMETGDPHGFGSIDDWVDAFTRQWKYVFETGCMAARIAWTTLAEHYSCPFISCLTPDCIQKGLDISSGGTRYPRVSGGAMLRVYADTADSLIAIKKLVYEEHKLTIDEILEACRSDFEGENGERIRGMLKAVPKYGNDSGEPEKVYRLLNDRVGEIALADCIRIQKNGSSLHFGQGKVTGALPNGRKAGVPLANGGISPSSGCDTKGPTASLSSAAKSVDWTTTRSAVLNQKMPKSLLKTRHHLELFVNLIETYFQDYGGYQVQWNIQDREVYLAAKANPSAYRDLMVRVGGYSAYFIELDPALQDEIIARTEQWV